MSKYKSRNSIFESIRPSLRKSVKPGRNDESVYPNMGKSTYDGAAFKEEKSKTAGNQYGMTGNLSGTASNTRNVSGTLSGIGKAGMPGSQGNIGNTGSFGNPASTGAFGTAGTGKTGMQGSMAKNNAPGASLRTLSGAAKNAAKSSIAGEASYTAAYRTPAGSPKSITPEFLNAACSMREPAQNQKNLADTDAAGKQPKEAEADLTAQALLGQQQKTEEIIRKQHEFEQWRVQETERLEQKKKKLTKQQKQLEQERMQLDLEKRSFQHQQEFAETRQKKEEQLLDMKRQLLENELFKLAEERKTFEQKRNFYKQVDSYQKDDLRKKPSAIHGTIFFAGVNNQSALRKRYKDLLKIYHPDNKCGDTDTIQEINREYQHLQEVLAGGRQ